MRDSRRSLYSSCIFLPSATPIWGSRGGPRAGDDSKLLECADAAGADYLVTGNQRHYPRFWKKTKVITPREFIDIVAPHLVD